MAPSDRKTSLHHIASFPPFAECDPNLPLLLSAISGARACDTNTPRPIKDDKNNKDASSSTVKLERGERKTQVSAAQREPWTLDPDTRLDRRACPKRPESPKQKSSATKQWQAAGNALQQSRSKLPSSAIAKHQTNHGYNPFN